ncbi:MAG: helix-turn-helix transcriptional regulator [Prevotella sp.]|nr:helix-turn-helix transcriptional regulator [Prevotella sp.]
MENNLSLSVRMLCRKQGITMRQLADKMQIAPESLSRAINGNPTLSTIQSIAQNLNVEVSSLFQTQLAQTDLTAIVVWRGKTLVTDDINSLIDFATDIKNALQSEEITENDINGKYHNRVGGKH